jgi:hypothetical protein
VNCKHVPDGRDGILGVHPKFVFIPDHARRNVCNYAIKLRFYNFIDIFGFARESDVTPKELLWGVFQGFENVISESKCASVRFARSDGNRFALDRFKG